MAEVLKSRKNVFLEALIVTIFIFGIGFIMGIYVEQIRESNMNVVFYESEVSIIDALSQNMVFQLGNLSCSHLNNITINFADKIYFQAQTLEKFDESNKITNSIKTLHKKYDLLRTLLWMNILKSEEKCGEVNTVVYLYDYDSQSVKKRAEQTAMSRVLEDLKNKEADNIVLIPIAANQNIAILDYLLKTYKINQIPAIIVNEKQVFYSNVPAEEIRKHLVNNTNTGYSSGVIKLN